MHVFDLPQPPAVSGLALAAASPGPGRHSAPDLIDPLISGNKWFKLRHHLQQAGASHAPGLISLGGNHSNHLHALAAAGKRFGFATVGLLRGHAQDTPTVRDLQALGMKLHWLGYGGYRARNEPGFWASWQARYPGWHCIPEGGGGLAGAQGCALIMQQARAQISALGWSDYDAWWLAAGTGTTLAGLVMAEAGAHAVHGALAVPGIMGCRRRWQHWPARTATSYTTPAVAVSENSTMRY